MGWCWFTFQHPAEGCPERRHHGLSAHHLAWKWSEQRSQGWGLRRPYNLLPSPFVAAKHLWGLS